MLPVSMSARRKALGSAEATTLNLWVQGPDCQRCFGASFKLSEFFGCPVWPMSVIEQNDSLSPALLKKKLRRALRQRRRQLLPDQQKQAAAAVVRRLNRSRLLWRSNSLAGYWPADGELDPRVFLQCVMARRKAVYLPVLRAGNRLGFKRWREGEPLKPNRYGIPEPQNGRWRPAWTLSAMLLPLVGFDRQGGRLGMGGGYYDRSLGRVAGQLGKLRRPVLVGLAHSCQEVAELPREAWDWPVDAVVTEREWIVAERSGSGE